jgi:hypothetical protein
VWIGVTLTARSSTIAPRKHATRQRGTAYPRTATAYTTERPRMTIASAFHDHAYGSTALR